MQRKLSLLAMMLVAVLLISCSGGGSSGGGSGIHFINGDSSAPSVTTFSMPATANSMTVDVTAFTGSDNVGVAGYMITTTSFAPSPTDSGWSATPPTSFTFAAVGTQTVYAWTKDSSGNVSPGTSATVTLANVPAAAVQGTCIDAQTISTQATASPLVGATVTAYDSSSAVSIASTSTDANGNFSMTGLYVGTNYYFECVQTGYVKLTYYNIIPEPTALALETFKLIPNAWQPQTATSSGMVKNASTNAGLPSMTVELRTGINNQSTGAIIATAVTDQTGAYSFANLAAGTYTAKITGNFSTNPTVPIVTAFYSLYSFPGDTASNTNQDFPVTAGAAEGQYKIVLNWGNNPSDLDSHLTGPIQGSTTRFHTAYYSVAYPTGSTTTGGTGFRVAGPTTEAFLDIDNTIHGSNNGPETTTIVVPHTGTYRFYVHHFAGSSNISSSGAQVKVYKGSALLATFNPPTGTLGQGAVWSVFTMDVSGTVEIIRPVNTIAIVSTSTLARPVDASFDEYFLFSNLPVK